MNKYLLQYKNEIIITVVVLIFGGVIKSNVSGYFREMEKIKSEVKIIEENRTLAEQWMIVSKQYKDIKKMFFCVGSDTAPFKRLVEDEAREAGVELNYLKPAQRDTPFLFFASIDLKTGAAYKNIIRFFNLLEDRKVKINKFSMNDFSNNKEADISISAFILKEGQ